jgi:hypothetical protein
VILSETEEVVDVKLEGSYDGRPIHAILLNVNDHGYVKVRFDQKSLETFENNLYVSY